MIFVLVSVLCSVSVSVMLKLAKGRGLDTRQIIIWNYPAALLLSYIFLEPQLVSVQHPETPWGIYILLAILLPSVFFALAASLRYTGLIRTEVAQRLSLIIPLIAAFTLFGESLSSGVLLGLGIGLVAVVLSINWQGAGDQAPRAGGGQVRQSAWLYPLLVFLGYGVCDVLFKSIAQAPSVPYTTSMFIVFTGAMLVAFIYLLVMHFVGKHAISRPAIWWGLSLGVLNFANILFYMKAHRALPDNPSIVFTGMNIGVISVGALVGVLVFRERLSTLNKIGLGLAIIAVSILAIYMEV